MTRLPIALALVLLSLGCSFYLGPAGAQELDLSALEALAEEDESSVPTLDRDQAIELAALAGFFALALVGFLRNSVVLKWLTMILAVGYMGFAKGNLVSLVHLFALTEWSFPIFKHNLVWYLLMAFTVATTILWGRLYCGRICAFGALTQLMDKVIPSRFRYELPKHIDGKAIYLKYVILFGAIGYYLLTKDTFIYKYLEPFWMFTLSGSTLMWILLGALLFVTVFIRNFYCRYLCSVGAALGILSKLTIFKIKRWQLCGDCKICEKVCEWNAIDGPKISLTECVRCDDCEILYHDQDRCPHWLLQKKAERRRNSGTTHAIPVSSISGRNPRR